MADRMDGPPARVRGPLSGTAIAALVAVSVGGMAPDVRAATDTANADLIAHGKYLSDVGDCMACHTAAGGQPFAGGKYMDTPFGPLSTPNITPDKATGIGGYTDDQFYRVFHDGVGGHGEYLYPAMPYPWYTKVTRDDVLAIKAYLDTLQPVNAPRKPNKMSFPFNIRTGLLAWQEVFFHPGTFQPDPKQSAEVNRGAYLVEGLGHCGECHNGQVLAGNSSASDKLQGGLLQNWYAPNITADVRQGIGKYSDAQLVTYLKTGMAQGVGVANGPMAETVHDSLSKVNDSDLHAMVAYLKSTPAKESYKDVHDSAYTGPQPAGREVYLNNCASCHQLNGKGLPDAVASLVGDGTVLARGPEDVIRVVLAGIEAKGSDAPMPAVGAGMTDQEIADVANYVRQAWGNAAPPTAGGGMVGTLRSTSLGVMNPGKECPTVQPQEIAAAVADPKTGISSALQGMNLTNVLQTVDTILPKVKAAAPNVQRADMVNGLTEAYCPIIRQDAQVPDSQKVIQLDNFSERLYSALKTDGKE